ncbi:hypothetical protein F5X68DRAFT_249026 [Plectosphaerella plurivora]|uniref:Uncharacterized protein n=1 Tax=Plectosphaerella plurivora TaxID=936078 RepID=A0A9P8V407_9PEZI|nr:hypothetical protein F5X68DRAFT_249026 [Plectosphaerella plurivora]
MLTKADTWPVSVERPDRGSSSATSFPQEGGDLEPTIDRILQTSGVGEHDVLDIVHLHRASIDLPDFQARLCKRLRARPDGLLGLSASPLLRLAYANSSHLNLAGLTGLTFEAVATSIRSDELSGIRALSLGIKDCTGSLEALLQVLNEMDGVTDALFLPHPSRSDDELSSRTFAAICDSPLAPQLLRSKRIKVTGAFSAPLRRKAWLLDARGDRLVSESLVLACPVQHMFVRQQLTDPMTGPQGRETGYAPSLPGANLSRRRIPTDAAFGVPVVRDNFEVFGDLKSFLRAAEPGGDGGVGWVDELLAQAVASIQERWNLEQLPSEIDYIMAMDDDLARSVFSDFLEDAAYIRGNVRAAMKSQSDGTTDGETKSRDMAIFNTLRGSGALWPFALGADRPATPPERFPWLPGEASSDEDL